MRSFDAAIITELAKVEARAFWMAELQFDSTYRFTDCDVDLVWDGDVYQSDQGLQIMNLQQGASFSVDRVTLEMGNAGLWMSSILLNEDVVGDVAIVRYIMYSVEVPVMAGGEEAGGVTILTGDVAPLDGDVSFLGGEFYSLVGIPPTLFSGYVTGYRLNEEKASIDMSTEFFLWRKKALRMPSASCSWNFKGAECTYAGGETWCDQSVERCKLLNNYDNFGGRRYIAAIEDMNLWWGDRGYGRK